MTDPGIKSIRVRRGGTVFHVHGDSVGLEGVTLGKDQVDGLWDAPVKTTYRAGAYQDGSRYRGRRNPHRDLILGFHVKDTETSYELNDSEFRRTFKYGPDLHATTVVPTTIEVETTLSGTRKLDVFMYEDPDFAPGIDPIKQQYGNLILKLRAPQPMWYEDDATSFTTVSNPTDQYCRHKWVLPAGSYAVPDYQWVGDEGSRAPGGANGGRTISVTMPAGGGVISLDRNDLMVRAASGANLLPTLGGKYFMYPIPPYTPPTPFQAGGGGQLVMPRRWSRPWGLEMPGL